MEPTVLEAVTITTIEEASHWAGFTNVEFAPVLAHLGTPRVFREVAAIPQEVGTVSMAGMRVDGPVVGGGAPPTIAVSARLIGMSQLCYRACMTKMVTAPGPAPVTTLAVPRAHPKMSSLVDPSIDSEVLTLDKGHVAGLFSGKRRIPVLGNRADRRPALGGESTDQHYVCTIC